MRSQGLPGAGVALLVGADTDVVGGTSMTVAAVLYSGWIALPSATAAPSVRMTIGTATYHRRKTSLRRSRRSM